MPHPPTDEQAAIRDAYLQHGDLVVEAGAGTGKTTTLRLLAGADQRRGLYVAYNKVTATEAGKSFPTNLHCSTAHALAYKAVGNRYRNRLNGPRLKGRDVATILADLRHPAFSIGLDSGLGKAGLARLVLRTVDAFCKSADPTILAAHVPNTPSLTPAEREAAEAAAVMLGATAWADLTDPDGRLEFGHDVYLKLWALDQPHLYVDVIMFDEAQDANPCVAKVVEDQTHAQRVAVGDECQSINGWNGARNAMAEWPWPRLSLTQSFRFGPDVADFANRWLDVLDSNLRLTGFDQLDTTVGYVPEPDAILCRGNVSALIAAHRELESGRKVAMVGGTRDIKQLAYAAKDLQAGRTTDHPQLYTFANWHEVQEYVEEDPTTDLRTFVKMIDQFGPGWVLATADRLTGEQVAEVVTSTVHKAKGREWSRVVIGGDFPQPGDTKPNGTAVEFTREDAMLAYVAVTRAREQLDPGGLAWIEYKRPDLATPTAVAA